jgi:hypothetical protein
MPAQPFDLEKYPPPRYDAKDWGNALSPRRDVLLEYDKVKFEYERNVQDRTYEIFYAQSKGRKTTKEVSQIYRRKVPNEGEFLMYNMTLRGNDWKGNDQEYSMLQGRYDKPMFRLEKDPQSQEVTSRQISGYKTIHDIPFSKEKVNEILEMSIEPLSLIVIGPDGKKYSIQSVDEFREGSLEDLVATIRQGKSLLSILKERGQYTWTKQEEINDTPNEEQSQRKKERKQQQPQTQEAVT